MATKCQSPFKHPQVSLKSANWKFFAVSDDLRGKAAEQFPEFQWKNVKVLCMKCKNKIASGGKRKWKRRGRKKIVTQNLQPGIIHNDQNQQQVASTSASQEGEEDPADSDNYITEEEEVIAGQDYVMEEINVVEIAPLPGEAAHSQSTQTNSSQASSNDLSQATNASSVDSTVHFTDYLLEDLNVLLSKLKLTPISKTTLHHPGETRDCWQRSMMHIKAKFTKLINGRYELEPEKCKSCEYCEALFIEMCARYRLAKTKSERFQILTSMPGKYTANLVAVESGCTYYTALKAMAIRVENGCFSSPPPKTGNRITPDVVILVQNWYYDDNNSRPSPKMNDTCKGPGGERIPRRLMMMNQVDAFYAFKQENQNAKIKKTKFLEFCPRNCVWPKRRPYHNVCVCVICQNFEFLYEALGRNAPTKEFIQSIMCNPVRQQCAYGLCNICPKMDIVFTHLEEIDDQEISYKQWSRTDGTDLQTLTVPTEDFSQTFLTSLGTYIEHDFVKNNQKEFIKTIKAEGLQRQRAILMVVDFAQNYSMIIQNAVQGYHWSGKQATVHPFSLSWCNPGTENAMEKHYVVISDEMTHDADTFNCFKRKVVSQIKIDFEAFNPTHIFYVSDGAAGQYKNYKNFAHLMEHFNDFQITAEWTFTATGHGKGPCDRVAAVVKSTARIHSLKGGNYILTPLQLYEFCLQKLQSEKMRFIFVTKEEVTADREVFKQRYEKTRRIAGTRSFHHFAPLQDGSICLKKVGGSEECINFTISKDYSLLFNIEEIDAGDFMCFIEAGYIQVGMFIENDEEYAEFQCFKIARRNFHMSWPAVPVYRQIPLIDILMKLGEPTPSDSRRYFTYTEEEIQAMHDKHDEWIEKRH